MRRPSLIGVHFTREEFMAVMREAHRRRVTHWTAGGHPVLTTSV
jgi:hypothetical protein